MQFRSMFGVPAMILAAALVGVPGQAQTVTYCNDATVSPSGVFTLTIPHFDLTDYSLTDAEVVLTATFAGQLNGQNTDPVLPCQWAFAVDFRLSSTDLTGAAYAFDGHAEADGSIPPAGGAEPNTVTVPLSGSLVGGYSIPWIDLPLFYGSDPVLVFTMQGLGRIYQMMGLGIFSTNFAVTAEVCVTYHYDDAIGLVKTSFGGLKATYR